MGCYGIGVGRLLAASIDFHSARCTVADGIRWPPNIAPFDICVIPPKRGSKEAAAGVAQLASDLWCSLTDTFCPPGGDRRLLVDDRLDLSVGRRLRDAKELGCLSVVVVNKTALHPDFPNFELIDVNAGETTVVSHAELFNMLSEKIGNSQNL